MCHSLHEFNYYLFNDQRAEVEQVSHYKQKDSAYRLRRMILKASLCGVLWRFLKAQRVSESG